MPGRSAGTLSNRHFKVCSATSSTPAWFSASFPEVTMLGLRRVPLILTWCLSRQLNREFKVFEFTSKHLSIE